MAPSNLLSQSRDLNTRKDLRLQNTFAMPADVQHEVYTNLQRKDLVLQFYIANQYQLAWSQGAVITKDTDSLIHFIQDALYDGLLPEFYHDREIEIERITACTSCDYRRLDALLTDAFLLLSHDLKYGRLAANDNHKDSLQRSLLIEAIAERSVVQHLKMQEPTSFSYRQLKTGLQNILANTKIDANAILIADKTDTVAVMKTIRRICINLERWRWEKFPMVNKYIFVNIPSYYLQVVEHDSTLFESKVIVGTAKNPTPNLSSKVECFVIYPYWHVPRKIAVEEYLPIIKRNISFITRNRFDVLDAKGNVLNIDSVPWRNFSKNNFPVILRQREGTDNSLGILKFVFDNPYGVYLHDTNAKYLFKKNTRAFSHGCIRMEKAVLLAQYLVTGVPDEKSEKIEKAIVKQQKQTINLKASIPIHIRYVTYEYKDETLIRYNDIYNLDQPLIDTFFALNKSF